MVCLHQGDQCLAVMQVCPPRDADGQGQTRPLSDQMDLRSVLAPVDRIRACQVPLFRARMFTESIAQRDQSSSPREPSSSRTSGGAWPTPWPSTTRQNDGAPSPLTDRTTQLATAATCSPTWPRTRSRPAPHDRRAGGGHRPEAAKAPPAPPAGTTETPNERCLSGAVRQ